MSKIDGFLNQSYFNTIICVGDIMEVSGKRGIVTEIIKWEEPQIREFILEAEDGRIYKVRFNGHMYHITEEIFPTPGI